ncbi:hypothetical protein ACFPTO_22890 [Paraburkholderia denitrificans]|uniref:Uncharacterized protein n=1 Tax=Paraburkholderia denitrificans TaxID=694025 RepID=A0ABW0JEL0_9BURK
MSGSSAVDGERVRRERNSLSLAHFKFEIAISSKKFHYQAQISQSGAKSMR